MSMENTALDLSLAIPIVVDLAEDAIFVLLPPFFCFGGFSLLRGFLKYVSTCWRTVFNACSTVMLE